LETAHNQVIVMDYRHVLNVVDLRWFDRASFLIARRGTAPPRAGPSKFSANAGERRKVNDAAGPRGQAD
jgi:hypothetical protein